MDNTSEMMPVGPAPPFSSAERGYQHPETTFTVVLGIGIIPFIYNNVDLQVSKFYIVIMHNGVVSGHKISKLDLFNYYNPMQESWSSHKAREYNLPSKELRG